MRFKILIIFLFFIKIIHSQNIKYNDIIDLINEKNYITAYSQLFEYQKKNPDFCNTYFQLGNISYYFAITSDPLLNIEQTEYHISNVRLYYGLAVNKLNLDNSNVKKNRNLYQTIPELKSIQKLENEHVTQFINEQIKRIEEYDKYSHISNMFFYKTLKKYNETVDLFINFIEKYNNLKDIYLENNTSIFISTNNIILSFDSTLYFFEEYKKSITKYPTSNYKQNYILQPITTYRLEGITRSNFLKDTVYLWDYKLWSNEIQKNINTNINHFRETIIKTNSNLNSKEKELKNNNTFSNTNQPFYLDQKVIFEIEKYDYNSVVSKLFLYRKAKIDFLIQTKRNYNDTSNHSININNRYTETYALTQKKIETDSLLLNLLNSFNDETYLKHKDFFDYNYQGKSGLFNYINNEKNEIDLLFNSTLSNLQMLSLQYISFINSKHKYTVFNNQKIMLYITDILPENTIVNQYYTTAITQNNANEKYISGFIKNQTGTTPFIAKYSEEKIDWLKTISTNSNSVNITTSITHTPTGCIIIVHSQTGIKHQNTIYNFDEKGNQESKSFLTNNHLTNHLSYDDIQNEIIVSFYDNNFKTNEIGIDTVTIQKIDFKDYSIKFQTQFMLDGQIINIIKMWDKYILIANYKKITINNQNYFNTLCNTISIVFDEKLNFKKADEINTNQFFWCHYAIKINSETINLFGVNKKNNVNELNQNHKTYVYYILLNSKNKIIYQNTNN